MATLAAEGTSGAALKSFDEHHIRFIVIKGPASAAVSSRSNETDVLRPRSSAPSVRGSNRCAPQLGIHPKGGSEQVWPVFDQLCTEGFNFHRNPMGNIDVLHHVSPWRFGKNLDFETLFTALIFQKCAGAGSGCLGGRQPVDLLFACHQ